MTGYIIILLIIFPTLFQIIYGRKAIGEDIKLRFSEVSIISFISQFVLTIVSFKLTTYMLNDKGIKCGMPLVGILSLSFLFTIILIIVIVVQYLIKKSYK